MHETLPHTIKEHLPDTIKEHVIKSTPERAYLIKLRETVYAMPESKLGLK